MDFNSAGSVEVMIGSGRYSNKRLLSTSVLVSKVTFSLYIPVYTSSALVCIQVMFPRTDNALILEMTCSVLISLYLQLFHSKWVYINLPRRKLNYTFLTKNLVR